MLKVIRQDHLIEGNSRLLNRFISLFLNKKFINFVQISNRPSERFVKPAVPAPSLVIPPAVPPSVTTNVMQPASPMDTSVSKD